jgi:hypothetical protein
VIAIIPFRSSACSIDTTLGFGNGGLITPTPPGCRQGFLQQAKQSIVGMPAMGRCAGKE